MPPARRDLRERREHETALREPGVGQDRIRPRPHEPAEVQDVEIDFARPVTKTRDASFRPLDTLESREKGLGAGGPAYLRDGVAKLGLVRVPDGVAPVEG